MPASVRPNALRATIKTKEEPSKRVATALHGIIKYGNVHPRLKSKFYRKLAVKA